MLKKTNDCISLKLNKRLYSKNSLDTCLKRFRDLCTISMEDYEDHFILNFSGHSKDELEAVMIEFANQALFFTKTGE